MLRGPARTVGVALEEELLLLGLGEWQLEDCEELAELLLVHHVVVPKNKLKIFEVFFLRC